MTKTNNIKVTLSKHRWERLRLMPQAVHGYAWTWSVGRAVAHPTCNTAFMLGDFIYTAVVMQSGKHFVRYHKDTHFDYLAFQACPAYSPHPPF